MACLGVLGIVASRKLGWDGSPPLLAVRARRRRALFEITIEHRKTGPIFQQIKAGNQKFWISFLQSFRTQGLLAFLEASSEGYRRLRQRLRHNFEELVNLVKEECL